MHVIILGSEGFVGKNLVEYLQPKFNLITSDLYESQIQNNYFRVDIRNFNELKKILQNIDVVIDLVANNLASSFDQVVENARVNIIGLLNILEAARINNVKKIIFPSASSMIGVANHNPVQENHPAYPKTPYGVTKLASEHYLRIYKELYGIDFVIFRFFNIYGPHQLNGLIPNIIFKMKKKEPIQVFGKGNQIRDYVFIKDIARFFEKTITSNVANNQFVNMGTGIGSTVINVIKTISKHMHMEPSIEHKQERLGEISNFVADTTLLRKLFGSVPDTSLDSGLKQTVEWYNSQ